MDINIKYEKHWASFQPTLTREDKQTLQSLT